MEVWQSVCDYLAGLGAVSNLSSILSLVISIITLFLAGRIRRTMMRTLEKKNFRECAQSYVDTLRSYRSIYNNDPDVINNQYFKNISSTLTEILDEYRHILPIGTSRRIKSLNRSIKRHLNKNKTNFGQKCSEKLNNIATELRKEKDIL